MAKRKPDPPTRTVTLTNVPSDIFHVFRTLAGFDIEEPSEWGLYETLSRREQQQALTEYFVKMVRRDSTNVLGQDGFERDIRLYKQHQKNLVARWKEKHREP